MKKILLLLAAFTLVFGLTACKTDDPGTEECPTGQELVDGECVDIDPDDPTEPEPELDYDPDAVYTTYISGVSNINPYSETLASSSEIFGYLTDSLYFGDYDWETAIADGLASEVGDFSGGADLLPYARLPRMAAGEPVDVNGDGTVWDITLRDDLTFEDGTVINAHTFNYSWRQLLDPKLLNDRASNLYADTDLPLVGAEAYFKQLSPDTDDLGFEKYLANGTVYTRANSYYGVVIGTDWSIYYPEQPYNTLVGPEHTEGETTLAAGQVAFVEDWGRTYSSYGNNGFVLTDELGNYFRMDSEGNLYAPYAGWTLDGVAVPAVADAPAEAEISGAASYAGALPAFMDELGNIATVDEDGLPVDGVWTYEDAIAVEWSTVGFEVIDDLTFRITLKSGRTAWDVKGALMSGITGVVHETAYEAGMNEARTSTTYGTIDNPLVSYGLYTLSTWQADTLFIFDIRDEHFASEDHRIKHIRYEFIEDQSLAVDEFKAGRLDVVGAGGDYYEEFKFSPNLKLSPATTFFRFAFNIEGSEQYDLNPILVYPEFRQAFYHAIDREEFATEVRAPSHPTQAFLGPVYLSTEFNSVSYRSSQPGLDIVADLYPETYGFNPAAARALFDEAYALAIADGLIVDGETVAVEYKFYDVETNWKVANWVKSTVEGIFNDANAAPRFRLDLVAVSGDALSAAWDQGDFEMTFGGWQGLNFNAPSMLGQVYNNHFTYMLEKGFNTKDIEITVSLPNSLAALTTWIADYEATLAATPDDVTDTMTESYDAWVILVDKFEANGDVTLTYHELFTIAYGELYNVNDVNYDGKTDDFDAITAALESVLLDEMIAIPLFTTVAATVYSQRVVFEADAYHAWMGWGGMKYMYIAKSE